MSRARRVGGKEQGDRRVEGDARVTTECRSGNWVLGKATGEQSVDNKVTSVTKNTRRILGFLGYREKIRVTREDIEDSSVAAGYRENRKVVERYRVQ